MLRLVTDLWWIFLKDLELPMEAYYSVQEQTSDEVPGNRGWNHGLDIFTIGLRWASQALRNIGQW